MINQNLFVKRIAKIQANLFTKNIFKRHISVPFDEQYSYLLSLGEPKNSIERMIFKHKCQMHYCKWISRILNIGSFFFIPFVIIFIWFRKPSIRKEKKELILLDCANLKEIMPNILISEYENFLITESKYYSLEKEDIQFIIKLVYHYNIPAYLLLRLTLKLAAYRYLIAQYSPKAILITNELSPTSVAMTYFCELNQIEHINCMHGEKLFTINESFNHFHRFYVFDEHYKSNFIYLKTSKFTQFELYTPPKFNININLFRIEDKISDFTYYLEEFDRKEIKKITKSLLLLQNFGYIVRVRPHPRFNDKALLEKMVPPSIIEDHNLFSIEQSISSTRHVVSVCSAILYQSLILGIPIVLDNVNYPNSVFHLKDKKYIVFYKNYQLLSSHMNKT